MSVSAALSVWRLVGRLKGCRRSGKEFQPQRELLFDLRKTPIEIMDMEVDFERSPMNCPIFYHAVIIRPIMYGGTIYANMKDPVYIGIRVKEYGDVQ